MESFERPVFFRQLELGPMQNFIYVIGDPDTREAAIVDPGWEVPSIFKAIEAEGYRPSMVLITHTHPDHIYGLGEVLDASDIPVYVHQDEVDHLPVEAGSIRALEDGRVISLGSLPIQAVHTPGHSPGSQCFSVAGRLLTGDTLFVDGCGRCDLPGGDPVQLYESLMRLKKLKPETILYPGHHYGSTPAVSLAEESRKSPFLKQEKLEDFLGLLGMA